MFLAGSYREMRASIKIHTFGINYGLMKDIRKHNIVPFLLFLCYYEPGAPFNAYTNKQNQFKCKGMQCKHYP